MHSEKTSKAAGSSNQDYATSIAMAAAQLAFLDEMRDITAQASGNYNLISDLGQIQQITLPPDWSAGQTEFNRVGSSAFREYHPPGQDAVHFCFYYRGLRTGASAGNAFRETLDKPDQTLSTADLAALSQTLRNKDPETFTVFQACTREINGKKVLLVEGSFFKGQPNQVDTLAVYIDSDGTGTAVQELQYQATPEEYPQYRQQVEAALQSIHWK
jgi:hypothetical protein